MRTGCLRRIVAAMAVVGAGAGLQVLAPARVDAVPTDVVAIVVEGTGFGHGRGLSQWGAYGYAVDHGWTSTEILDHYYGGTEAGSVDASERIRVRLTELDDLTAVAVVSYGSPVIWNGFEGVSMYAEQTSPGTFTIYGSSERACAGRSSLTVPNGASTVAAGSAEPSAVANVQRFLRAYHSGEVVVDGDFGAQTVQHLLGWQDHVGLVADGEWNEPDAALANAILAADTGGEFTELGTVADGPDSTVTFAIADGDDPTVVSENTIGVCRADRSVQHYRGRIDVLNITSGTRVVNDVLVEDYLRGVLPKEIAASWAADGDGAGAHAVQAQAVAARSYGLQQSRNYLYDESGQRYATTCDTPSCQVYGGAASRPNVDEAAVPVEHPLTDAAALATAGVVRRWPTGHTKAGELVSTEFSASNGPRTAGGAFPPVDDVGDDVSANPNHRWTRVIDADALEGDYGIGQITAATMVEPADSTYQPYDGIWFNDLVLTGTSGSVTIQAWEFRNAFDLPSPGFTVRTVTEDTTSSTMAIIGSSLSDSVASKELQGDGEFDRLVEGTFAAATIRTWPDRCTLRPACPGLSGVGEARALSRELDVVVVELDAHDDVASFSSEIDIMMAALEERAVGRVAWVNFSEAATDSSGAAVAASLNAELAAAQQRWPSLTILDWDAATRGVEAQARWFADGQRLTSTGRAQFALWLRTEMLELTPS